MRPWRSEDGEIVGLVEWWRLLPRSLKFQAKHAWGLGRYRLGARGGHLPTVSPPT